MVFPTIPSSGTTLLTSIQANTTAARTFPSLSSLTKSSGNLLLAIVVAYQASGTNASFGTWGGGFTELTDLGTSGSTMAIGVAYKWSTGSETGTFTVTQAGTPTGHAVMFLMAIPGAHGSTVPEVTALASGTTGIADPAALTPSWGAADTLWISLAGGGETSTTGSFTGVTSATAPASYSGAVDTGLTSDVVGGCDAAVAFRQLNAASENVGTWASTDISNARNSAMVIAVRPLALTIAVKATGTGSAKNATVLTTENSPALELSGYGTFAGVAPGDTINLITLTCNQFSSSALMGPPTFELWDYSGVPAKIGATQTGVTSTDSAHIDSFSFAGVTYAMLGTLRVRVYAHKGTAPSGSVQNINWAGLTLNYSPSGAAVVPLAESGSGTTGLAVPAFAATGAGSDSIAVAIIATIGLTDSGQGTTALAVPGFLATGAGSDSLALAQQVVLAESGTGSDALFIPAFGESGQGSDSLALAATVALPETGAGADAIAIPGFLESGAGTDSLTIPGTGPVIGTPYLITSGTTTGPFTVVTPSVNGDTIIVAISSTTAGVINGINDSKSNTYSRVRQYNSTGSYDTEVWEATNTNALTVSDTVTVSFTSWPSPRIAVIGCPGAGTEDVNGFDVANGTSTTPSSGVSGTLSQATELVIGVIADGNIGLAATWDSPWNSIAALHTGTTNWLNVAWQLTASTAPVTASGTIVSAAWTAMSVSFLPSAGATTPVSLGDAGAGSDALGITAVVAVALTEAGTASDSLYVPAFADTGSGADSLSVPTIPVAMSDLGSGTTGLFVPAFADSGAGSDSVTIVSPAGLTDSGSGTDSLYVPAFADTGQSGDVLGLASAAGLPDSGAGTDSLAVPAFLVTGAGGDSLSVPEAGTPIPVAVTGQGTDSLAVPLAGQALAESGSGADVLAVPAFLVTGSGAESIAIPESGTPVSLVDSGTGADAVTVGPPLAEAGTGTESLGIASGVSLQDVGAGSATFMPGTRLDESGAATDLLGLSGGVALPDSGTGTEALWPGTRLADAGAGSDSLGISLVAAIALADSGAGADVIAVFVVTPVPLPEAGTGADSLAVVITVGLTDVGSGTDRLFVPAFVIAGSGTDSLALPLLGQGLAEPGSGLDSLGVMATVALVDSGAGSAVLGVMAGLLDAGSSHEALATETITGFPGEVRIRQATGIVSITNRVAGVLQISQQVSTVEIGNDS